MNSFNISHPIQFITLTWSKFIFNQLESFSFWYWLAFELIDVFLLNELKDQLVSRWSMNFIKLVLNNINQFG